jgi:hypothetical protein
LPRVVPVGAVHGEATVGANREGHGRLAGEAYCRRRPIKPQGGARRIGGIEGQLREMARRILNTTC